MAAEPLEGPGLTTRRLRVHDTDVVLLRAIVEAYEGLAALYGDGSGGIALSAPCSRSAELDQLVEDLPQLRLCGWRARPAAGQGCGESAAGQGGRQRGRDCCGPPALGYHALHPSKCGGARAGPAEI